MEKQYSKVLLTLKDLGHEAREGSFILDFGCGNGSGVKGLRERGYEVYGCDMKLREEGDVPALARHGHVRLIESHLHIPLASIIQQYWYLYFWAKLGIRNDKQKGMLPEEAARYNCNGLNEGTNYLSKKKITSFVEEFFDEYEFCDLTASRHSRVSSVYPVIKRIPFASQFLSTFQTRILYLRKN